MNEYELDLSLASLKSRSHFMSWFWCARSVGWRLQRSELDMRVLLYHSLENPAREYYRNNLIGESFCAASNHLIMYFSSTQTEAELLLAGMYICEIQAKIRKLEFGQY